VQQLSAYDLIYLGTALRFLQDSRAGMQPKEQGGLVRNFEHLVSTCEELGLKVSARAAQNVLGETMTRLAGQPDDYALTREDAAEIVHAMGRVRVALDAESESVAIYALEQRRYDAARLMTNVDALFAEGTFAAMSEMAAHDFREAGRCLVFGVPTASAFHLLRGTEEVLRGYYGSWVRRNRIRGDLMWGPMVTALRAVRGADGTVLNHLDHIRTAFRNPTDHPEKIYDQSEAEDLMGLCIEVVNRMVRTMRPSRLATAQPTS
jgi:hypothetical protein